MNWRSWKELSKQELYDLLQLRIQIFAVEQKCAYQDCDDLDKRAQHLLAYNGSKLVGYLRVFESLEKYQNSASIGRVCCDITKRGSGLGQELMIEAVNYIDTHYKKDIVISAQFYLINFYKALGFEVTSDVYLEDGIEHIGMKKMFEETNEF